MTGREILEALRCGRPGCACSKGKVTHCPAHDDRTPSLSITDAGGKALFHCHTGCAQADVIAALKERGLWGAEAVMPTPIRSGRGRLVTSYEYRDADGVVLADHGRFETATGKTFAWRLPGASWDVGLGSLSINALPLYGLQRLQDAPEAPVWVVEGEKAADAAYAAGLAAVCLGGGAAQQTFGNALDPLRDRDVILWPDNDEAGATLMGRIAGLLPQARYVRPVVPAKGDAFDYFEAGGTVLALLGLLEEPSPVVRITGRDSLDIDIPVPAGLVRFEFTELMVAKREVSGVMRIEVDVPGKPRIPMSTRINLEAASARNDARREIEGIYPGKDLNWTALLMQVGDLCKRAWRGMDKSKDLINVALPEARRWAVENFAPESMVTIIFGMGGSQKSLLLADILLHALYGMPWKGKPTATVETVMVVDYEDHEDEWRLRVQQLCDGYGWAFPESGYRYFAAAGVPLADQAAQLNALVAEHHIGLLGVDSAISASGGDLLDTQAAARLVGTLHDTGASSILVAHNTKAEDSKYPYGSIFWHNLVRATHYVEAQQEEGSLVADVAVYNRKANRGLQKPLSIRVTYSEDDTGPTYVELQASMPAGLRKLTLKDEMITYLLEVGEDDATSVSKALGHARPKVAELLRTDAAFVHRRREGKRVLYGVAANV